MNKFKTVWMLTLAIFVVSLFVPSVYGQVPQRGRRPMIQNPPRTLMPKLDLTDEQKELLKGLQEKHREIQKQFREKVKNLNQELWELRKDAEANAAEIEGLRDEMFNLRIEQMKSAYLHRKEIKKVFTAEQLKTMAVWRSQIRENRAGINRRMPRGGQFMTRGRNPAAGRFMGRMQFPRCRVMWRDWFWRFRW